MKALIARGSRRRLPALAGVLLSLIVAGTVAAGSGIGGVFNLGARNAVNYVTTLTGSYASRLLQVTNTSTSGAAVAAQLKASSGTPLQLVGSAAKPPFTTNSGVKVTNLNADRLDSLDSSAFLKGRRVRVTHSTPGTTSGTSPAEWFRATVTQPAGQALIAVAGEATATVPYTCGDYRRLFVIVTFGGGVGSGREVAQGEATFSTTTANTSVTFPLRSNDDTILAPAAATARPVVVTIFDECTGSENWTVSSIKLDFVFAG